MSRIGKLPIALPPLIKAKVTGNFLEVSGPEGTLSRRFPEEIKLNLEGDAIKVNVRNSDKKSRAMWGLSRTLASNMVRGVHEGWIKELEIVGVGFKASMSSDNLLLLSLGYSHDIFYALPPSIKVKCNGPTSIRIFGPDKQFVGQVASEIRALRSPEPYKGKGIRYKHEAIRRKEGKKK